MRFRLRTLLLAMFVLAALCAVVVFLSRLEPPLQFPPLIEPEKEESIHDWYEDENGNLYHT